MRNITLINDNWNFSLNGKTESVNLPHTWNNFDGQDGTNGYVRAKASYKRKLPKSNNTTYLECCGVNAKAEVIINGVSIGTHIGGYSGFRFDISEYIKNGCEIEITADNTHSDEIYPAIADFTFYGGIYRNVNLIEVGRCHFSMSDYGSDGVYITPIKKGEKWFIQIKSLVENALDSNILEYFIKNSDGKVVATAKSDVKYINFTEIEIPNPVLWQGIENPYLYTLECSIRSSEEVEDNLSISFGLREINIDSCKGFLLNNKQVKLKGVSRHQDRENMGNAITEQEHAEDVSLILDVGANSVRLAHYQQNSFFYDLCDENGLLVWAEIPMISRYSKKARKNAKLQLVELIKQNYNHPSIYCWGIENEITIGRATNSLVSFLKKQNALAKKLDSTRYTTCAQLSTYPVTGQLNSITDILGYNHYFGWYMDTVNGFDKWLDSWRKKQPDKKLCISEYGAEGILKYHSENPVQGDYSEDYQALYHEHYIKAINEREWLFGSYVWNMFDFGSASRNEGGIRGRNNKGLVTFDRKIKKDSFYLYKAFWSDEKFVHITKKRFGNRLVGKTKIKIYSNCDEITLEWGKNKRTVKGDKIFVFENIDIAEGNNKFTAKCGKLKDVITINGVTEQDASYVLPENEKTFVRNWFNSSDGEKNPDMLSVDDTIGEVIKNPEVYCLIRKFTGDTIANAVSSPLLKPIYRVKVKSILKIAKPFGLNDTTASMAEGFLQTVRK